MLLPEGEQAFAAAMKRGVVRLREELRAGRATTRGGEQRAFVIARALEYCRIALVGAPPMEELSAVGIRQFASLEQARDGLDLAMEGARVFVKIEKDSLNVVSGRAA